LNKIHAFLGQKLEDIPLILKDKINLFLLQKPKKE
jgi:hypothetical protein